MKTRMLYTIMNIPRVFIVLPVYALMSPNRKSIVKADIDRYSFMTGKIKSYWFKLAFLLVNNRAFRNIYERRITGVGRYWTQLWFRPMESLEIGNNIGPGLCVYHGYATVIQANSIGSQCSIWQNVTIGRRPQRGHIIDAPTIGNDVKVYTGASVIGDIKVGNNVSIGAGSVVIKDVPDNAIVVGNPARIVGYNKT